MKRATHAVICIIGAVLVCVIARLLDVWVTSSTSNYGSAQYQDASFLWTSTLARIVIAVPLGVLCWMVLYRRPALVVPIVYLVCSIPLLVAFLVVPTTASFDVFRDLAPYPGGHENLYASLVFIAAIGVAAFIRARVVTDASDI
jgi:hypothetical protein